MGKALVDKEVGVARNGSDMSTLAVVRRFALSFLRANEDHVLTMKARKATGRINLRYEGSTSLPAKLGFEAFKRNDGNAKNFKLAEDRAQRLDVPVEEMMVERSFEIQE